MTLNKVVGTLGNIIWFSKQHLKEYYEIVGESRPLSGFFPTHAYFFNGKCISKHETISNPPSFREIRALIASQSTFEI